LDLTCGRIEPNTMELRNLHTHGQHDTMDMMEVRSFNRLGQGRKLTVNHDWHRWLEPSTAAGLVRNTVGPWVRVNGAIRSYPSGDSDKAQGTRVGVLSYSGSGSSLCRFLDASKPPQPLTI